ncbi:hypothetical protein [Pseudomonas sp. MWU12-2345]|uniref:hypothetical protein n=1 Tax=Pseudomonas sp. MWU12-2345 TaxID=2928689 RepID=UPI00200D063B|nr:hypothetical protein [Pseudomonas sp. MWU12-2345]
MLIGALLSIAVTAATLWLAAHLMNISLGFVQALIVTSLGEGLNLLLPEARQQTSLLWILLSALVYFISLRIFTGEGYLTLIKLTVVAWVVGLVAVKVSAKLL